MLDKSQCSWRCSWDELKCLLVGLKGTVPIKNIFFKNQLLRCQACSVLFIILFVVYSAVESKSSKCKVKWNQRKPGDGLSQNPIIRWGKGKERKGKGKEKKGKEWFSFHAINFIMYFNLYFKLLLWSKPGFWCRSQVPFTPHRLTREKTKSRCYINTTLSNAPSTPKADYLYDNILQPLRVCSSLLSEDNSYSQ